MSSGAASELPGCTLHEAAAESYLTHAAALLREARLGAQFPPGRAVLANLEALSARCHRHRSLPGPWTRIASNAR